MNEATPRGHAMPTVNAEQGSAVDAGLRLVSDATGDGPTASPGAPSTNEAPAGQSTSYTGQVSSASQTIAANGATAQVRTGTAIGASTAIGAANESAAAESGAAKTRSALQNDAIRIAAARQLPVDPTKISPKLGELLLASGKMNKETVARVLHRQKKFPDRRFGELAVARRFASQRDVDAALAQQFGYTTATGTEAGLSTEIAVAHTPYSPFAEVLRGLRSQLILNWFDGSLQQSSLAVTSVDPGDGKSFIIANLGVVFSQLGERTLIIDADLRNSSQHRKFGLRNKMGLSGLLSGRAGVEEIMAIPGLSNLAVLPAGPLPPNPQELLGREVFGQLINALAKSFDVILIDTPAAQMSTDAQIIAQRTRGAVIVGRKDKTRMAEIEQLGQVLSGSGVKVLGSVLNEY